MAAISDAFTVGVILLLIFSAITFYLYTRIQQTEKRLNLCENILLDLKVAAEHGAPSPADFLMHNPTVAATATTLDNIPVGSDLESSDINEFYEQAIDAAYNQSDDAVDDVQDINAIIDDITVEKVETTVEQVTDNVVDVSIYDSLNVKELKNLAKQHHISGASSMSRNQLIDALSSANIKPTHDEPQGSTSALIDTAEQIDAAPLSFD
jgi:hypothetical protein